MRWNKKPSIKSDKTQTVRSQKRGVVGYSKKSALLEEAITQMNAGKYARSSAVLKELLALDPDNMEARRLFASLHLRLGSLIPARQAFDSLIDEAFQRQDYWLAESLLREYLSAAQHCVPYLEKLGRIYEEKGDTIEAVTEYGKAVDILIEDPDAENSQRASQLYTKIRDLAPVSPVAFRLASFFDAQTGELLTRHAEGDAEPASSPSPDPSSEISSSQDHAEPLEGAMPWELPISNEAHAFTSPSPSTPPVASTDVFWQGQQSTQEQTLPSESQSSEPEEERVTGEGDGISGDIHPEEVVVTQPEPSISSLPGAEDPGHATVEAAAIALDALGGSLVTRTKVDPIGPRGDAAAVEEEQSLSVEPHQDTVITALVGSGTAAPTNTSSIPTPATGASEPPFAAHVMTPSNMEEDAGSTLPGSEVLRAETAELQIEGPSSSKSPPSDSQESSEAQLPDTRETSRVGPSLDESSEPRPEVGLSWDAVFNNASQSENQDLGNTNQHGDGQLQIKEPVGEAPAGLSSLDLLPANQSGKTHETDQQFRFRDATSTGTSIAPMAWDQVQDSAVPIPPAQLDTSIEDSTSLTVDQAKDTQGSDWASPGEESGDTTDSLQTTSHEPDSFSITRDAETIQTWGSANSPENNRTEADRGVYQHSVPTQVGNSSHEEDSFSLIQKFESSQQQDSPFSLEVSLTAADSARASFSIKEEPILMEPEPQGSLEGSPIMDQPSIPEIPTRGVLDQPLREEPSVGDQTTAQDEIHIKNADSVTRIEDEPPPVHSHPSARTAPIKIPAQAPRHTREAMEEDNSPHSSSVSPSPAMAMQESTGEPEPELSLIEPIAMEMGASGEPNGQAPTGSVVEARVPMHESVAHHEEWEKVGESIRFIEEPHAAPSPQPSPIVGGATATSRPLSSAASAVEALFESSSALRKAETKPRESSRPSDRTNGSIFDPVRGAITSILHTCFSTTRSILATFVGLMALSAVGVVLCVGGLGLVWVIMEEQPSPVFQTFTTIPQRTMSDSKKNGYVWLLGMDAAAGQDPTQGSGEQNSGSNGGTTALTCFGSSAPGVGERSSASSDVMRKWFRGSDPIAQFKSHQGAIKGWGDEHQLRLERYGQWKKLSFEDWGYGQSVSPPCATIAFAHQLHVAGGFVQSIDQGVNRLEIDMEVWRIVLSQARTLPMKMLALQAINDDIAVASGLLIRSDFDGTHLGRVTKFLRPLDQGELSIRWPMQSELVTASKTYDDQLKAAQAEAHAVSTTVAAILPLPKQRRLNEYAKYYEASYKVASEGQYSALPKWKSYIQFPATTFMDYLTNPIENIVGLTPLPRWDEYNGFVVDTDAHLRLASLQAWLRRSPADGDLLARLAKAGQSFYDPYTGLPMLVNMKKSLLYSVGHDGKDQDGDPELDVVAEIPVGYAGTTAAKSTVGSSRAK